MNYCGWKKNWAKIKVHLGSAYSGVWVNLSLYAHCYGGWKALLVSPFLHISVVGSFLLSFVKTTPDSSPLWFDLVISVLPNLLGFTLAGYAIIMSVGSDKFISIIGGKYEDGRPSPFMVANGTFVHFVILQVTSIILAIVGKRWGATNCVITFIGYFFFIYSLTSGVATALAILTVADWRNTLTNIDDNNKNGNEKKGDRQSGGC